VGADGVKQ